MYIKSVYMHVYVLYIYIYTHFCGEEIAIGLRNSCLGKTSLITIILCTFIIKIFLCYRQNVGDEMKPCMG